ncbi:hypothetical protein L1787_13070 [Acuticoccus sp. M5D2P5]|uniref:hypothetical protein n=1 Tax=Acuticoccus kalidii TaxID=2910977 RepID=UPI001F1882D7|nr:hypothetical protein [Acuticoccus kalidii]MCF3934341.1 hypothetical protein [Acuticoccus kalidii]
MATLQVENGAIRAKAFKVYGGFVRVRPGKTAIIKDAAELTHDRIAAFDREGVKVTQMVDEARESAGDQLPVAPRIFESKAWAAEVEAIAAAAVRKLLDEHPQTQEDAAVAQPADPGPSPPPAEASATVVPLATTEPVPPRAAFEAKPSFTVIDKGRGWYVITADGKELTKSLRKEDVDGFDALSDEDKGAFVEAHKVEG